MERLLIVYGCLLVTLHIARSQENNDNLTARWEIDPSPRLAVKKSASLSNIEVAVKLSKEQQDAIVKRHNDLRTIVRPSATKMRKMTWDKELADAATNHSRKCIYEHNKVRKHSRFNYIGENLYISTGIRMRTDLLTNAVSAWDGEKVDYDYETRTCKPGRRCGDYTQIVWDDTFKVGCGVTICKSVRVYKDIWRSATLFVCNYGPGGNYPRHPFVSGRSCTACDVGDGCEKNLCTNPIRDENFYTVTPIWNEWSAWSTCSTTCLGGISRRERTCSTFIDSDCDGYRTEITFSCSDNLCDFDPSRETGNNTFNAWGEWSSCSVTCGNGRKQRTRICKTGNSCSGVKQLTASCNLGKCTGRGGEGLWSRWGQWTACSVTCGPGVSTRRRKCGGSVCPGRSSKITKCHLRLCAGDWSKWSSWTKCSATCGGGSKVRGRTCKTGSNCIGLSESTRACKSKKCPDWSKWSSWTKCSATCGGGSKVRSRTCKIGSNCIGSSESTRTCKSKKCPGMFSPWTAWAACSRSCGSGTTTRTRTCPTGTNCNGPRLERNPCHEGRCPDATT